MKKDYIFTLLVVTFLASFTLIDVFQDIKEKIPISHWAHELIISFLAILLIIYKLALAYKRDKKLNHFQSEVEQSTIEIDYYKKTIQLMKLGFNDIVENQFKIWGFTKSESEIALLVIKGLSMKEIAELRGSSEITVRQQATSVYRKSHLENRGQLAAYFLEDLFT